ncbi:MAG TPA: hypothetical protein VGN18_00375 [Jatrophihabitans sp.]|jgi:hypothetical protein|uniref:hypothetical protein n=1 Tax=Jatrophihabitans sp. TaxID=1932789 RepID=UPI002E00E8CB|nr:hypothetical protein [Jatrophihabitans sp.]
MTGVRTESPTLPQTLARRANTHLGVRLAAAALLVAVAYIHFADQGFLAFAKDPAYLQVCYVIVEVLALLGAVGVLAHPARGTWLLALGCAAGPLVAFVLTRTIGLPNATDDIGNWGEPLAVASLVVEGLLLLIALAELNRLARTPV